MTARVKKQKDVRKQEFVVAAMELFCKKGYEKTSVQNIIDKVKVSKGAFYHYFNSKEDILRAIAEIYTRQAVEIIEKVLENKKLNALQKINKIIADVQTYKEKNHQEKMKLKKVFQGQMFDPKFQHEMMEMTNQMLRPTLKKLFEEGVKEGVFKTEYPEELAEHYFSIMASMKLSLAKPILELSKKAQNKKIIERKLNFFQDLLERLLGVKKGSIKLAEPLLKRYLTYK